jgi:hypothetical protein
MMKSKGTIQEVLGSINPLIWAAIAAVVLIFIFLQAKIDMLAIAKYTLTAIVATISFGLINV